jgi:hypothetical protein
MNETTLIGLGGLAAAGLVAYVAHLVGDRRRAKPGKAFLSSIPEGLARAKRGRRRLLVAFVAPGEAASTALLDQLAVSPRHFEIVKIDAPADGLEVVAHLAAKYGLPKLALPTLLVLDGAGEKIDALEGADVAAKLAPFIESVKPGG